MYKRLLLVLTNEKGGGIKNFDKPRAKLFTQGFSKKSAQTPSCDRSKITQRRVFLLFEDNNCIQLIAKRRGLKNPGNLHHATFPLRTIFN
jgi:hypothetical protein